MLWTSGSNLPGAVAGVPMAFSCSPLSTFASVTQLLPFYEVAAGTSPSSTGSWVFVFPCHERQLRITRATFSVCLFPTWPPGCGAAAPAPSEAQDLYFAFWIDVENLM